MKVTCFFRYHLPHDHSFIGDIEQTDYQSLHDKLINRAAGSLIEIQLIKPKVPAVQRSVNFKDLLYG